MYLSLCVSIYLSHTLARSASVAFLVCSSRLFSVCCLHSRSICSSICPTFSNVNMLVHLLCKGTRGSRFQHLCCVQSRSLCPVPGVHSGVRTRIMHAGLLLVLADGRLRWQGKRDLYKAKEAYTRQESPILWQNRLACLGMLACCLKMANSACITACASAISAFVFTTSANCVFSASPSYVCVCTCEYACACIYRDRYRSLLYMQVCVRMHI